MNLISVKNIEHTVAPHGGDIITQEWTYPRAFHAEVMTHRDKSRNAESSRAYPVIKKLEKTALAPWIPAAFTRNQRGMQGGEALDGAVDLVARTLWETAFRVIDPFVRALAALDVHKQYANRLAEPWATITIVITGTEWENMDALRAHTDAFPEFQELMWVAIEERLLSKARAVGHGNRELSTWHLPYVGMTEREGLGLEQSIRCSVARCARVSYLLQDGSAPNIDKDNELYDRLLSSGHMSPFEHQATPLVRRADISGNFRGWRQYRKTIPNEVRKFNYWDACEKAGRTPVVPRPVHQGDST